jgi:hypothetical protein
MLLLAHGSVAEAAGKRMYRYKNAEGVTVIKDYLPPDVAPKGYEVVDEYGHLIERVPPVKTAEEIAREKERERLAKIEQKKIQEQLKRDNDLLRQYTTTEDIERARDNMLDSIRVEMGIRAANTNRIRRQLAQYQTQAADFERRGQPIPKALKENIDKSLKQIADSEAFIERKNKEMARIREDFARDIARFEELKLQRDRRLAQDEAERARNREMAFYCEDFNVCAKAWQLAQLYVKDHASGRIELITDTLIITEKPRTQTDIALTVSRIPDRDNRVEIRIDAYCRDNVSSKAVCSSPKAQRIIRGFVPYLRQRLQETSG